jgi:hypothetical protein
MKYHNAICLATAILIFSCSAVSRSQDIYVRTVRGTVVGAQKSPLSGAVVYLYNLRTRRIRSYITDKQGRYRFLDLKLYDDYEIHAETEKLTSGNHEISASDDKTELTVELIVDKVKSK